MKEFRALMAYQMITYRKKNKYVGPVILYLIFLFASYSIKPQQFVSSMMVSFMFLFYLMSWVCMGFYECDDMVNEQILLTKTKKEYQYYLSKMAVICLVGFMLSVLCVLLPYMLHLAEGKTFFIESISATDLIFAVVLHIGSVFLALGVTYLFQPRCIKDRRLAVLLLTLIEVVALVKGSLIEEFWPVKLVLWILPPIYDTGMVFEGATRFLAKPVIYLLGYHLVYGMILLVIGQKVLNIRKF